MNPAIVGTSLWSLASLLARTWHIDVIGEEHVRRLEQERKPFLYAVWHGQLLAPLWHRRDQHITLLVSAHHDGGYLAAAARGWGYNLVRGSSTRGGVGGLRGLLRTLGERRTAAVTPDGPRGPAHKAKPGIVAAAQQAGAVIVPVGVSTRTSWQLRSWDRFVVPKPFAHVNIRYGTPLSIDAGADGLSAGTRRLEHALVRLGEGARCSG